MLRRVLTRVLRAEPTKVLVGKDYEGNCYYEIPPQRYMYGMMTQQKTKRVVEGPVEIQQKRWSNPDEVEFYIPKVPREWDSWLRWKREHAPSLQELSTNIKKSNVMQERIHRHELKEAQRKARIADEERELLAKKKKDEPEKSSNVESWGG